MNRVRGGRGLGDALYVRAVAEKLKQKGPVTALTDYADVFIGSGIKVAPFQRNGAGIVAHYVHSRANEDTTQWQDVCRSAGINAELRFSWKVQNAGLVRSVREKARGRAVVLVHGGREPMDRKDGFGLALMPKQEAFDAVLRSMRGCFLVQIGKAEQIYPLACDLDLNGQTTVSDVLDLAWDCDAVITQCGFPIPLAECFDKPLLAVWGAAHKTSNHVFIRQTTPQKVLSSPRDSFVMDAWGAANIQMVARELLELSAA